MSKELKILINNEEVVCDKQISIDEKMLSTSSTILKNCYPKFWETDKDYVSRFYFPKDYSKCRISYDEFHPEDQGEIVTGTNLSINYDNTKNFELLQLQGNTTQQTYTGKNLFDKFKSTSSTNGASLTQINNGIKVTVTVAGANKYIALKLDNPDNLLGKTLTISGNIAKSGSNDALIRFYFTNGNTLVSNIANTIYQTGKSTFTVPASYPTNCNGIAIVFSATASNSGSVGNYVNYTNVQLEVGSTQTSYEPYVGGTASPNPDYPQAIQNVTGRQVIDVVGKNLWGGFEYINTGYIGITFTHNNNGTIIIDGTNNAGTTAYSMTTSNSTPYQKTLSAGTYTISGGLSNVILQIINSSGLLVAQTTSSAFNTTFTINQETKVYIRVQIANGVSFNNQTIYIMLEKGSTATTYEEYKGQSYEINLGKNLVQSKEINSTTSDYATVLFVEADLKPNTTYTISYDGTPNNKLYTNENLFEQVTFTNTSGRTKVTTTTKSTISKSNTNQYESGKGWKILKNGTSGAVGGANVFNDLQLETGSQATTYSPYFTPIELNKIGNYQDSIKKSTGKNLFDISTTPFITRVAYNSSGVQQDWDNYSGTTTKTKVQPNTTYTLSENRNAYTTQIVEYDSTGTFITRQLLSNYGKTFTTGNNTYLINISISDETIPTLVQLEQNSQATPYEPYLPIGTWYIEKKIGKVVLNGTENWQDTGTNRFNVVGVITDYLKSVNTKTYLSNYYVPFNQTNANSDFNNLTSNSNYGFNMNSSIGTDLRIKHTGIDNVSDFKTWLSNNNVEIYYVLSTPTYTEITNTDLINQLESIELLNGINNITVTSPNVPGALKIHYNFKEAYTESDLVFCGVVKNTGNISLNPREPHYVDLQILDFKCLLSEGETLNYVINDKTIPEAIEQVVASISDYGFVIGNINILNPNDKINAYSTLNKTAYDVFQYIADVTQSKWATRVIDEDTIAIDFYDPTLMPQASSIEYNQTYFENNDIENMTFNYSTNDYRNKQIMTSDEVFGNIEQIETIICNGYQDTYTCQNKIGIIKKITVNDVECTFATKNEVELGVTADFIYQPGEIVFTSSQIYTSGSVIVITYLPIVKGREIVLNNEESSRISSQINRKGTISRYENRNDTTSGQELIKIGQSYIKYKGSAEITLKIVSSKNLFNVGQIVEFNAPLEELSTEYMVKNKTIDIWTIDSNETQVFYTYELSSNFNSENAINYFDNQRAKNQGNIGEGETIVRNIDIENTVLIQFYETNIEEVEISNISTLDFSLDAVLI